MRSQLRASSIWIDVARVERVVDGEISQAEYPELVEIISSAIKNIGDFNTLGSTLVWRTARPNEGRMVSVTITPRGGQTRIRIQENLANTAGGFYGGIMGGVGGGGAVHRRKVQ